MDNNPLSHLRNIFDKSPTTIRFLYYLFASLISHRKAAELKQFSDVYLDRSVASTIAYHKGCGLSVSWLNLVPKWTINQIDQMIYFVLDENTRIKRITERISKGKIQFESSTDKQNSDISIKVDKEFRNLIPSKTIIIQVNNKNTPQITKELKRKLYGSLKQTK
jgi:thymidylate kinase